MSKRDGEEQPLASFSFSVPLSEVRPAIAAESWACAVVPLDFNVAAAWANAWAYVSYRQGVTA